MELIVVFVGLELGDLMLPVGIEDVSVLATETLVYLENRQKLMMRVEA